MAFLFNAVVSQNRITWLKDWTDASVTFGPYAHVSISPQSWSWKVMGAQKEGTFS